MIIVIAESSEIDSKVLIDFLLARWNPYIVANYSDCNSVIFCGHLHFLTLVVRHIALVWRHGINFGIDRDMQIYSKEDDEAYEEHESAAAAYHSVKSPLAFVSQAHWHCKQVPLSNPS